MIKWFGRQDSQDCTSTAGGINDLSLPNVITTFIALGLAANLFLSSY